MTKAWHNSDKTHLFHLGTSESCLRLIGEININWSYAPALQITLAVYLTDEQVF